jgi:hypothetical protein
VGETAPHLPRLTKGRGQTSLPFCLRVLFPPSRPSFWWDGYLPQLVAQCAWLSMGVAG